jgi:RNA polymerase nonessential primary-like sigma factor
MAVRKQVGVPRSGARGSREASPPATAADDVAVDWHLDESGEDPGAAPGEDDPDDDAVLAADGIDVDAIDADSIDAFDSQATGDGTRAGRASKAAGGDGGRPGRLTPPPEPFSASEEISLVLAARAGDNGAREQLVRASIRSIGWMARRYRGTNVDAEDLMSEGVIGIFNAIERFDPARGVRFSTYARWWVREAMGEFMMKQSRTVRLPANVVKEIGAIAREMRAVENDGDGAGRSRMSVIGQVAQRLNRSAEHVEQMLALRDAPVPIEALPEPETATGDGEGTPNVYQWTPESLAVLRELLSRVYELMDALSERERIVLVARYGLETGVPETLESIAARLELTAERVRQVQQEALVKLHARFKERGLLPR